MTSDLEKELEDNRKKFNEKTISNMTYKEIIENNKVSRKGTFMDRSWRDN